MSDAILPVTSVDIIGCILNLSHAIWGWGIPLRLCSSNTGPWVYISYTSELVHSATTGVSTCTDLRLPDTHACGSPYRYTNCARVRNI